MNWYLLRSKILFTLLLAVIFLFVSKGSQTITTIARESTRKFYVEKSLAPDFAYLKPYLSQIANVPVEPQVLGSTSEERLTSLPVIYYHGVTQDQNDEDVTQENFLAQMTALKKAGYQSVTLTELYDYMNGKKELPPKSFVLTFDDGRRDSFYPVDPVLEKLGYTASMFLIASTIDTPSTYHLVREEIEFMLSTGRWEIGSHSYDGHRRVAINQNGEMSEYLANKIWLDGKNRIETDLEYSERVEKDMLLSKKTLEEAFGRKVFAFAIPFGAYGQDSVNNSNAVNVVQDYAQNIFDITFYQPWDEIEKVNYPNGSRFVKRIEVGAYWSDQDLLHELEIQNDKPETFSDDFSSDMGWRKLWGLVDRDSENNSLLLSSREDTTGAGAYLLGTSLYTNYVFSADAVLKEGYSINMMTDLVDSGNYTFCTFGKGGISINRKVQGKIDKIKVLNGKFSPLFTKEAKLSVSMTDTSISCLVNDVVYVRSSVTRNRGGIGVSVWTDTNKALLVITDVSIISSNGKTN